MTDTNNVVVGGSRSDEPSSISSSLLVRLRAQQPQAWDRLAQLYGPLVFHWCLKARLQPADAEDVLQEVFRTVATRISSFRRDGQSSTFRGWLWSISRNKIGDYFRRSKREPQGVGGNGPDIELAAPAAEDAFSTSSSEFEAGTLFQEIQRLVRSEFEERTWDAFWRVVIEGHAPKDVAHDLETSSNAVYLAKSRVLRRLREELGDVDD